MNIFKSGFSVVFFSIFCVALVTGVTLFSNSLALAEQYMDSGEIIEVVCQHDKTPPADSQEGWINVLGEDDADIRTNEISEIIKNLPDMPASDISDTIPGADGPSAMAFRDTLPMDTKKAILLLQPGLGKQIIWANIEELTAIFKRFRKEGYEVVRAEATTKNVLQVITKGQFSKIIYLGHGGAWKPPGQTEKISTLAGRSAQGWKTKVFSYLLEHYSKPGSGLTQEQAFQKASEGSKNFGFEEVVNMSCYSLSDHSTAKLFCKPGGIYWGVPQKYSGLNYFMNSFMGAQNNMIRYVVPGKSPGTGLKDIVVNTMNIQIIVWDHGCEDGDKITIEINDEPIINNLTLKKKKQTFPYTLTKEQNSFRLIATDSGTDCPPQPKNKTWNSATIVIKGATKNARQVWVLKQDKDTKANLIYQP